jgi:hypothetical protein
MDPQILGYQGAPYAPGYQPSLDEQLAAMPPPQVLGPVAAPPEGPGVSYTPILGGQQYSAPPPTSSANAPGPLYSAAPNASFMPTAAPSAAPTAAPQPTAATATAAPAAPPRGAQAPRAAGPAKLSEIGQIQTTLAKQGEQAASDMYNIAEQQIRDVGATTEAAQSAETKTIAERSARSTEEAVLALDRENDAAEERRTRKATAEETAAKLTTAQGELENTKLDIDAAYGGASGRIFSGLAVALGSFGASMTGGPNYALQIVNDRVNREIDAQKSEIEKKKGKVTELGRLLQQNENLLGDATAARKLAQAQTSLALASEAEAQAKGRALGPQQQAVVNALRTQAATTMRELQTVVETRGEETRMIAARERQAQRVAAAAVATAARLRRQKIEDELTVKTVESGLRTQEAEAKARIDEGGAPGMPATNGVPPKAMSRLLDELGKPVVGVKDLAGVLQKLNSFQSALDAYGGAKNAPGASTYGFGSSAFPNLTDKARELDRARKGSTLSYRHDLTGANASEKEDAKIEASAGGEDPNMNQQWIDAQRKEIDGRIDLALRILPENQRAAAKVALYGNAESLSSVKSRTGYGAAPPPPAAK